MPQELDGSYKFCGGTCTDKSLPDRLFYCEQQSMKVFTTKDEIKRELYTYGPLMADMWLYEDFMSYK